MEDALVERKAKTGKGKRFLKERGSKVHENWKTALILKGNSADENVKSLLLDIHDMKKPYSVHFTKRNQKTHPFEDAKDVEYLCQKNDASLFAFGSKSKKRPFRLLLGRTFDGTLLDMQEFAVTNYRGCKNKCFKRGAAPMTGSKPLVLFQGSGWESDEDLGRGKNLLLDFFRGACPDKIVLQCVDRVLVFSVLDGEPKKILMRHYRVLLKKSGTKLPRVELEEIGPSADLSLDRGRGADTTLWKAAMKAPKEVKPKKEKNISTDVLGSKRGRLHLEKQDFTKLHTPHAHKKRKTAE